VRDLLILDAEAPARFLDGTGRGVFRERTLPSAALAATGDGGDAVLADVDGDGALDYLSRRAGGRAPALRYLRNLDRGRFVDWAPSTSPTSTATATSTSW
jgi:hypothetical protein